MNSAALLQALRRGDPAVMGYIREDRALFDLRTVDETEIPAVAAQLRRCLEG